MKFEKLHKTVESVWGTGWRNLVLNRLAGPRKLAAVLSVALGELTLEQAEVRFKVNSKSPKGSSDVTWCHATRIVKAAVSGDTKPLIEAMEGRQGRDVCKIGREMSSSSGRKLDAYTLTQERIDRLTNIFVNLGTGQVKIRPSSAKDSDSQFDVEFHVQKIHIGQLEMLVKNLRRLQ